MTEHQIEWIKTNPTQMYSTNISLIELTEGDTLYKWNGTIWERITILAVFKYNTVTQSSMRILNSLDKQEIIQFETILQNQNLYTKNYQS